MTNGEQHDIPVAYTHLLLVGKGRWGVASQNVAVVTERAAEIAAPGKYGCGHMAGKI